MFLIPINVVCALEFSALDFILSIFFCFYFCHSAIVLPLLIWFSRATVESLYNSFFLSLFRFRRDFACCCYNKTICDVFAHDPFNRSAVVICYVYIYLFNYLKHVSFSIICHTASSARKRGRVDYNRWKYVQR